jgi:hypothetical protein
MIWGVIIIGCKCLEEVGGHGLYLCLEEMEDRQEMEFCGRECVVRYKNFDNTIFYNDFLISNNL